VIHLGCRLVEGTISRFGKIGGLKPFVNEA